MIMTYMKINKSGAGFTILELLVVIAIIGLLSTLAIASFRNVRLNERDARRITDLEAIGKSIELYKIDNSNLFSVPAAAPGAWAGLGSSELDIYLPSGMPADPVNTDGQIYTLCVDTVTSHHILVTALEGVAVSPGLSGTMGVWTTCLNSLDGDAVPSGDCNDVNFCAGYLAP